MLVLELKHDYALIFINKENKIQNVIIKEYYYDETELINYLNLINSNIESKY